MILSLEERVVTHAYITQNNKVAFSLQYIKKEECNEIDFSHVDKHESSLQINTDIWLGWSNISRVPKISSLQCLYNISKSKLEQINIKFSYKFISTLWVAKFSTSWYYFYWQTWSRILRIPKLTSLQYLYNISKKRRSLFFASR